MIEARSIPSAAPAVSNAKRRCAALLGSHFYLFRGGAAVRPPAFLTALIDPYFLASASRMWDGQFVVPPLGGMVWRHGMVLLQRLPPKGGTTNCPSHIRRALRLQALTRRSSMRIQAQQPRAHRLWTGFLMSLFCASIALGQAATGNIRGAVTDANGEA